ncbi:hypothetical protein ACFST9_03090 [Hymenobacter monticola]|uniref:Delta-60 repeat domain-containing protein n=1 Tax=Hymenobacter monticola TaxID=1705399 RepID=A0ABY4B2H0_9BACT|nr:delta-60 repeat domain-containing protein [Hymenobacter monticola]UOE33054.1 delta-60 repeat domain-containing protein [Hymenobacter monticola]
MAAATAAQAQATTPDGFGYDGEVHALAYQPDGKVVVGGKFGSYNGNEAASDCILRLNRDGTLDKTFNYRALEFRSGASGFDSYGLVKALALQPDGKILVGGYWLNYNNGMGPEPPSGLMRLNPDGSLDKSFNLKGEENLTSFGGRVNALALQPDGKIVVGTQHGDGSENNLVRLNPDGSLDRTFAAPSEYASIKGFARAEYSGGKQQADVNALLLQPDGKILVAGNFDSYNGDQGISRCAMRLNRDGTIDKTFSYRPSRKEDPVPQKQDVLALALQPDGKILIGGIFVTFNAIQVIYGETPKMPHGVMRLLPDGSRDESFNPNGTGTNAGVAALALQPDGRVLVGGGVRSYNGDDDTPDQVFRLLPNGTLDKSFNYRGAGPNEAVQVLVRRPNGKIVIGGGFSKYNGAKIPAGMLELNADGSAAPLATGLAQPDPDVAVQEAYGKKIEAGFAKLDQAYGIAGVKFETPASAISNKTLAQDTRDTKLYTADDRLAVGPVQASAAYIFYKDRLREVRLRVPAEKGPQLLEALQKAYGPGLPGNKSVTWDSEKVHLNYSYDPAEDKYANAVLWSNALSKEMTKDMRADQQAFKKNNTPAN